MPVKGSLVLPSSDTVTPYVPIAERTYLTPDDFEIPRRHGTRPSCFEPAELAPYLYTSPDTIIRMIDDGLLLAVTLRPGGSPKIPYASIARFFLRQQGAMS
jgi:hypothetical protein